MPTFDSYTGVSDPVQYICHLQEKIMLYSRNDPIICLTFPSRLKGATSEWFYSISSRFFHNILEITEAFLTQYATR